MNENEIEVKAKLSNKNEVLEYLKKSGALFLEKKYQKDIAFWPNDTNIESKHILGRCYLRIREQETKGVKKVIFTLKQPCTNQMDCIEHEIEIKEQDINSLKSIIYTLGYYEFITIEKIREIYQLNDIEVCIDDVKNLGSYIELEKFAPGNEVEKVQNELYDLLGVFNINKENYVYDGYDILIHKSINNL